METGILKIDRIAEVNGPDDRRPLMYSPHGYLVVADGTIYTLAYQWYHGIGLALLFPEVAAKYGVPAPISPHQNNDVFSYQAFELTFHDQLQVIRVCPGRMVGNPSVNKGFAAATEAQIAGMRRIFKAIGLGPRDMVYTDSGDETVTKCLKLLAEAEEPRELDEEYVAELATRTWHHNYE